jgi:hypothetical protein
VTVHLRISLYNIPCINFLRNISYFLFFQGWPKPWFRHWLHMIKKWYTLYTFVVSIFLQLHTYTEVLCLIWSQNNLCSFSSFAKMSARYTFSIGHSPTVNDIFFFLCLIIFFSQETDWGYIFFFCYCFMYVMKFWLKRKSRGPNSIMPAKSINVVNYYHIMLLFCHLTYNKKKSSKQLVRAVQFMTTLCMWTKKLSNKLKKNTKKFGGPDQYLSGS